MSDHDDERKLNRRTFLKYTAAASATAGAWYAITAKTDALAQPGGGEGGLGEEGIPYHYMDE